MDRKQMEAARAFVQDELLRATEFWLRYGADGEHGGVYTCLDRYGSLYSSDKSVWMQGRCAWTYAHLCQQYGVRVPWMQMAKSCLNFLEAHCVNHACGDRLYFSVTEDGRPLRQRRYCFSEGFYAIGNAAYYALTKEEKYLARARRAYDLIYFLRQGGSDPAGLGPKTVPETRETRALADPMIYLNITTVLREVDAQHAAEYDARARACVEEIREFHYKPQLGCTLETVGKNGDYLGAVSEGRIVNPGHDIECSWFLLKEAERTGNRETRALAEAIYGQALSGGWDAEYGGLLYFIDCEGRPPQAYEHDMKLWWPHNELLIASLMLYRDTGKEAYLADFYRALSYCKATFCDTACGEWFGYCRRDGKPTEPACKGSAFKGPFHVQRSLMAADALLGELLAGEGKPE